MGQQGGVRQMPEARSIICHGIDGAREIINGGAVAEMALKKGVDAYKVRGWAMGSFGTFAQPCTCRDIIREGRNGMFGTGTVL